jgi:hypothetical protein
LGQSLQVAVLLQQPAAVWAWQMLSETPLQTWKWSCLAAAAALQKAAAAAAALQKAAAAAAAALRAQAQRSSRAVLLTRSRPQAL